MTDIEYILEMTRSFLDGEMDPIFFKLDFPYEVEKRFKRMRKENEELAFMIYDTLIEKGAYLYDDLSTDAFHRLIKQQYNVICEVYHGDIDFL